MEINSELQKYIENNILTEYSKNDEGHNLEHAMYVIRRSLMFANNVDGINYDMVYTIAAYHDVAVYVDRDNHEKLSGERLYNDSKLRDFFSEDEIKIMSEAVEDHRASLETEPRSVYGKIVSSADRNVDLELPLKRTLSYRMRLELGMSMDEVLEESRQHLMSKFGEKGYAKEKMYFEKNGDI